MSSITDPAPGSIRRWLILAIGSLNFVISMFYRVSTAAAHWKNKRRRNLYGDMGIFTKRAVFERLGGYREMPLFEDVEFGNRLKKLGNIVILDEKLVSSSRGLKRYGAVRTFARNDILKIAYSLGLSPEFLKRFYCS